MKTIEELKKEQYDAKAKLYELVESINSEEFYTLTPSRKNILSQRRVALEMYLNSLTKELYDSEGSAFDASSTLWPMLMTGVFSNSLSSSMSTDSWKKTLDEKDLEVKTDTDETGHND